LGTFLCDHGLPLWLASACCLLQWLRRFIYETSHNQMLAVEGSPMQRQQAQREVEASGFMTGR
ncbi:hypothetical protein, partial [Pseudomonas syringae]|uniref:hypothetical protein n=1 Tax=Pseudomonas syringae TaxID=317 RepID=UPI001F1E88E2